jgi:hypothetical protein
VLEGVSVCGDIVFKCGLSVVKVKRRNNMSRDSFFLFVDFESNKRLGERLRTVI